MSSQLDRIEARLNSLEAMIQQLLNPVQSMDTQQKAVAIHKALMSGDRKYYRDVLKQINGE